MVIYTAEFFILPPLVRGEVIFQIFFLRAGGGQCADFFIVTRGNWTGDDGQGGCVHPSQYASFPRVQADIFILFIFFPAIFFRMVSHEIRFRESTLTKA